MSTSTTSRELNALGTDNVLKEVELSELHPRGIILAKLQFSVVGGEKNNNLNFQLWVEKQTMDLIQRVIGLEAGLPKSAY